MVRFETDGAAPRGGRTARLGMVVSGSLGDGVEVKLDPAVSIEEVRVGRYVTIEGDRMRFFGVVTDVSLGSTDPTLRLNPPDVSDPYIADVVSGTTAFGIVDVEPLLTSLPIRWRRSRARSRRRPSPRTSRLYP